MAKKIIKITYNPYDNHIKFIISLDSGKVWQELADTSELLKYQNQECVFSNCVEDIVSYINQYQNSSLEGLCIQFVGTGDDFSILEEVVKSENRNSNKKGKILTEYVGVYKSADESIEIIRSAYNRISSEFEDYLPGNKKYETNTSYAEIGDLINLFTDTVSSDIPICVIGTYSVGKSAFINAIIGDEILPSKVDPCTAKDVKVESGTEVSFSIEYKGEPITYVINPGHIESRDEESEFAEEFRKAICEHCVFLGKNSNEILHDILIALNESEKTFPPIADVGWNISIRLPFVNSILKQDKCKIIIFDTPGSNNSDIDQHAHRESLEKMMGKQTNALPIFVMDRNQVISNDNNEVKSLLDENRKGFSNPNCLIVFSKAENIPTSAFSQPIPPAFLNWHGKATFLYVCAVGAIGEKKRDERWLDPEYQDGYKDWKLKYNSDHRTLPSHNIVPCGRVMDTNTRALISDELYATGIPSVEDEINYYVQRYANYKKCVSGSKLLQNALLLAKKQLKDQKKELAETKDKKEKEQTAKRNELIKAIDGVKIKTINIQCVIEKYQTILDDYCSTVLPEIQSIWGEAKKSKNPTKYVEMHMQTHCMEGLFLKAYEGETGIQREIVKILSGCANDYKAELLRIVKGEGSSLSEDALEELSEIFNSINTPNFVEVGINGNQLFNLIAQIPFFREQFEKMYIESIAESICKQLKHQKGGLFRKDRLGLFAEQCIQQPVQAYFSQLKTWQSTHIDRIKETLDKDNYILSQYDAYIIELEQQIERLENRLNNLTDVEVILGTVLNAQELEVSL